MVKRYSFGHVFQTDSIPVIPEAQTGAVPYMEVNESEMSLTYTMDPEDIVYGLGENAASTRGAGSTRASAATSPSTWRTAGPCTPPTTLSWWTEERSSDSLSIIRAF